VPDYSSVQPGGGRPFGTSYPQGQGRNDQPQSGGYGNNGGNQPNGQSNGRRGKKQRPQCQLCGYWGHDAFDCRNRFNQDFIRNNNSRRSGNAASMTSNNNLPPWLMDSGATDHITNDLERLHMHERYTGKDNVQVANGKGLSISHIGHSTLAGSSIQLKNILHVPGISQHLLSVYRLVADNLVFVEFHRDFFFVKDKATRRILLHGRSKGGLYPVPVNRASSSSSSRHASSSVKVSPSQWHQRLGHPSNNIVQTIVKNHSLPVLDSDKSSSICDACQCGKSH
jgi:histone deacetylase 1/2